MKENFDFHLSTKILESLPFGVFAVDRNKKIIFFNKAAEKITGISSEKALGEFCKDIFHSNRCDVNCILDKAISNICGVEDRDVKIINFDGEEIPLAVYAFPLFDKNGELIGGVEVFRDISEEKILRDELKGKFSFQNIIGNSKGIQDILRILPQIAKSDSSVLIYGETGTGKEVIAKTIHSLSYRKNGPFVALNCGAIPENLLESELFGFKKGSFTGADRDKPGIFQKANGGTLFLDEIGELPLNMQVKILRVLEEKRVLPIGGLEEEEIDIRLVSATNRDLKIMVDKGEFRKDLYYRINIVEIYLPPLRERKEDIPLLVNHFIKKYGVLKGKKIKGITKEAMNVLLNYEFPGNVRELENIIEYAFIMCDKEYIDILSLPPKLLPSSQIATFKINDLKKKTLIEALKITNCNLSQTANLLGIHRSTLYRYLSKFNINARDLCKKQQ